MLNLSINLPITTLGGRLQYLREKVKKERLNRTPSQAEVCAALKAKGVKLGKNRLSDLERVNNNSLRLSADLAAGLASYYETNLYWLLWGDMNGLITHHQLPFDELISGHTLPAEYDALEKESKQLVEDLIRHLYAIQTNAKYQK